MRNLIYTILILLTATTATAQSLTRGGGNNQLQSWYGGFKVVRLFNPPFTFNPWATYDSLGMVWIDSTTTKKLMWHTGVYRRYVASEAYVDSLFATAVTGVTQQTLNDSCAAIRADISGGSTDSTTFATNYRVDTAKQSIRGTRVPYTGAIANLNLGTYELLTDAVQYNLTPSGAGTIGRLVWSATDNTLEVPLSTDVTMQIGQENYVRCVNTSGSIITNGSVVYINDAQGNRPTIALAQANSVNTSLIIGVATEDIAINAEGFVTTQGIVRNIDTRPFTTDGQALYLSVDTAGLITKTIPTSPNLTAFVGFALNTTVNGSIYVRPEVPISADTSLAGNSNWVSSTQAGVKAYVDNRVTNINSSIADRVKYTDTAAMLLPYQRTVNATSGTVTSVATGYGVSGGTITTTGTISADTAAMATRSRVQKAVDSLNIQDGLRVKYTDTASMLLPYQRTVNATSGTVTSVATNTGTGITGGTITTSGTIAADTTVLGTRAWRDKLKDSLNAQDALRVKYTDTSGMLAPYLRTVNAVTATSTTTLTNKRWTARVTSQTTVSATPSINTDNQDIWKVTAQTADITSMTTNLTGTPVDGDILEIQITGTAARAITWGSSFVSSTVTLPTTTTTTATLTVILQYYSTSSYGNNKWVCVSYW